MVERMCEWDKYLDKARIWGINLPFLSRCWLTGGYIWSFLVPVVLIVVVR